jgi:hypothetical protein
MIFKLHNAGGDVTMAVTTDAATGRTEIHALSAVLQKQVTIVIDPVLARRLARVLAYIVDGGTQPSEGGADAYLR